MTLPVFWHEGVAGIDPSARVRLDGAEGHHAAVVRRLRAGERLTLTDGAGVHARCRILDSDKRGLDLLVEEVGSEPAPQPRLCVVQAIPKGDRAELAVEMLTEVGVDTIVPWAADRCVAVWRGERAERSLAKWRRAAAEAAKQARRTRFPEVSAPVEADDVARMLTRADLAVVLHEEGATPIGELTPPARGEVVVVVGPEGGLSEAELETFAAVGTRPVRLGDTVLRASTAGTAAAAALLARTARWA